jgi:hypothetical protein
MRDFVGQNELRRISPFHQRPQDLCCEKPRKQSATSSGEFLGEPRDVILSRQQRCLRELNHRICPSGRPLHPMDQNLNLTADSASVAKRIRAETAAKGLSPKMLDFMV